MHNLLPYILFSVVGGPSSFDVLSGANGLGELHMAGEDHWIIVQEYDNNYRMYLHNNIQSSEPQLKVYYKVLTSFKLAILVAHQKERPKFNYCMIHLHKLQVIEGCAHFPTLSTVSHSRRSPLYILLNLCSLHVIAI